MDPFSKNTTNPTTSTPDAPPAGAAPASPMPQSSAEPVTPTPTAPPSMSATPAPTTSVAPVLGNSAASASAAAPMQTGHVEKSNKLLYLFIGLLLVILVGLIGLFFYNQMYAATAAENKIVVPTTMQATPTVVVPTYASEEEKEVMGVEVGEVGSQLKIIEEDVNKL